MYFPQLLNKTTPRTAKPNWSEQRIKKSIASAVHTHSSFKLIHEGREIENSRATEQDRQKHDGKGRQRRLIQTKGRSGKKRRGNQRDVGKPSKDLFSKSGLSGDLKVQFCLNRKLQRGNLDILTRSSKRIHKPPDRLRSV
jgi:hypothetical protein